MEKERATKRGKRSEREVKMRRRGGKRKAPKSPLPRGRAVSRWEGVVVRRLRRRSQRQGVRVLSFQPWLDGERVVTFGTYATLDGPS